MKAVIVSKFLGQQKILRLTTINTKGVPHTVPVWYLYHTKKIYVGTNLKTVKAKNLQQNKNVAFCVDTGVHVPNIYGVMGQGKARLITDKTNIKKIAIKILSRYFRTITNKSMQELLDETDCVIEITPNRITKWNY